MIRMDFVSNSSSCCYVLQYADNSVENMIDDISKICREHEAEYANFNEKVLKDEFSLKRIVLFKDIWHFEGPMIFSERYFHNHIYKNGKIVDKAVLLSLYKHETCNCADCAYVNTCAKDDNLRPYNSYCSEYCGEEDEYQYDHEHKTYSTVKFGFFTDESLEVMKFLREQFKQNLFTKEQLVAFMEDSVKCNIAFNKNDIESYIEEVKKDGNADDDWIKIQMECMQKQIEEQQEILKEYKEKGVHEEYDKIRNCVSEYEKMLKEGLVIHIHVNTSGDGMDRDLLYFGSKIPKLNTGKLKVLQSEWW